MKTIKAITIQRESERERRRWTRKKNRINNCVRVVSLLRNAQRLSYFVTSFCRIIQKPNLDVKEKKWLFDVIKTIAKIAQWKIYIIILNWNYQRIVMTYLSYSNKWNHMKKRQTKEKKSTIYSKHIFTPIKYGIFMCFFRSNLVASQYIHTERHWKLEYKVFIQEKIYSIIERNLESSIVFVLHFSLLTLDCFIFVIPSCFPMILWQYRKRKNGIENLERSHKNKCYDLNSAYKQICHNGNDSKRHIDAIDWFAYIFLFMPSHCLILCLPILFFFLTSFLMWNHSLFAYDGK